MHIKALVCLVCLKSVRASVGWRGVSKGGGMWEMSQLGHGHRACRAREASVRILAFTLNGRPLEAIEQGGA